MKQMGHHSLFEDGSQRERFLISFTDSFLAIFLLFPSVCFFWRGSWDLITHYTPGDEPNNDFLMFFIGCLFGLDFLLLPLLDRIITPVTTFDRHYFRYFALTRLLLYIHAVFYMFFWRGTWGLATYYIGLDWETSAAVLGGCIALLSSLRCLRSTLWPPYFVITDVRPDLFVAATRFQVSPSRYRLYIVDSLFTSIVITGIAVLCWFSAFNIMDHHVYPNDALKSDLVCFAVGILSAITFFSLQLFLAKLSTRIEKTRGWVAKLIFEDVVYLFVFALLTPLWRGGWNLTVRYFITDPVTGGWVNHYTGAVLLVLTQTLSYVSATGCIIDGQETEGGAFFPIQYTSVLRRSVPAFEYFKDKRRSDIRSSSIQFTKDSIYHISQHIRGGLDNEGFDVTSNEQSPNHKF